MYRINVNSGNILTIGYDLDSLILEIEFPRGAVYEYYQVPHVDFIKLITAESHGKTFESLIKGVYEYKKVGMNV